MVSKNEQIPLKRISAGDAAVDGLFAGLMSGLVMAGVMMLLGLLRGELPTTLLARFSTEANSSPIMGLLRHLAVSGTYGLLFGLLSRIELVKRLAQRIGPVVGMLYGALLFAMAELVILPGTDSLLLGLPPLEFATAHLVYGLVLAAFYQKISAV